MITDDCIGCKTYDAKNKDCDLSEISGICPCSICLVKCICIVVCQEYLEYCDGDEI